jgi:hypothetical protein
VACVCRYICLVKNAFKEGAKERQLEGDVSAHDPMSCSAEKTVMIARARCVLDAVQGSYTLLISTPPINLP